MRRLCVMGVDPSVLSMILKHGIDTAIVNENKLGEVWVRDVRYRRNPDLLEFLLESPSFESYEGPPWQAPLYLPLFTRVTKGVSGV